ncbi:MAG: thiosulfate oxidation carrier protein SoxY [Alphaproteobacteria bacterium]|jgi:sulfur-oxidizing protein SoxY|nr:thiosulfate oxidation carrier protein SoxY [Alphaproteobacteria bacterium]MBT7944108.1 thiosulfate oxidation carrier protein SoxY [Alphaproteobacteria bacterium]
MSEKIITKKIRRRDVLAMAGTGVVAVAGIGLLAGEAKADMAGVNKAMMKSIGDKKPKSGRVTLELPQIAENGNTVPIAVEVQSPMTDKDYVKALHVYAEGNPSPEVASFRFTPDSGKARVSTRMRMIKSQNIVAVAEMSDGSVYMGKKAIKVTIGGCGG